MLILKEVYVSDSILY